MNYAYSIEHKARCLSQDTGKPNTRWKYALADCNGDFNDKADWFILSMWDSRKSLTPLHILVFYKDDIVRGDPFWMRGSISIKNTPECLEEFREYEVTNRLEKLKELCKKKKGEHNMNKNILVTGAMGFIGSHYVKLLVREGYDISILDKMTYAADMGRIEDIKNNVNIYIGDICNKDLVQDIISKHDIDIIVNMAAETHVDNSINDSKEFVKSNFEDVQTLLDVCRENDIEKYVQISTDEVYGSAEKWSFDENGRLNPGNPYSTTKAAADLLCLSYCNTYQLPIVITRSSNNYGPYQHTEKFIPKMITSAIHGKPLLVYGDGSNVRDWLYVKDNCKAIKQAMENGKIGEIYNIGGGKELTNNYVASLIAERFGVEIEYIEDRKGHDKRYSINCDKIKDELEWKPVKKFEEGLDDTIRWYVEEEKKK